MNHRKLLPLSGIVFVAVLASAIVAVGGSTPDPDASAANVASFYEAHQGRQTAAALVLAAAVPFLVFFAVALAAALEPAEETAGRVWGRVLVAGSVLAGATAALNAAFHFALADAADNLSAGALQVLNVLDGDVWVAFNAGMGVMMLGAAGMLLSRPAVRRWPAWTALALGIALFVPYADFFALLLTGLWIVVASIVLSRRTTGARRTLAPQAA